MKMCIILRKHSNFTHANTHTHISPIGEPFDCKEWPKKSAQFQQCDKSTFQQYHCIEILSISILAYEMHIAFYVEMCGHFWFDFLHVKKRILSRNSENYKFKLNWIVLKVLLVSLYALLICKFIWFLAHHQRCHQYIIQNHINASMSIEHT